MALSKTLQRAIEVLEELPSQDQDAIAARLLAEAMDERSWKSTFETVTDEQWERLAASVREEIATGEVFPLQEVLDAFSLLTSPPVVS